MAPAAPRTLPPAHLPEVAAAGGRALQPGAVLAEFEFGHVIAESRFAVVYAATDHSLDRQVAIKEYLPASLVTRSEGVKVQLRSLSHAHAFERGRRAFIEEAKQLARCDHPSLLRVLRIVHANGTVYRVMPYTPGPSLLSVRQQMHAPPDEAALRSLLGPVLGALEALHRRGIVHGEVSPAKILLANEDGERPLLLDFGAVRRGIVGDPTRNWMSVLGAASDALEHEADAQHASAPYRWPADGSDGPWNDVSALAATLYFWITGHWPEYPPAEPLSRVVARLREYLPELDYSVPLLAAIDAALAPRLQDRPQGVAQLREMLESERTLSVATLPVATLSVATMPAATTAPPPPLTEAAAPLPAVPLPTLNVVVETPPAPPPPRHPNAVRADKAPTGSSPHGSGPRPHRRTSRSSAARRQARSARQRRVALGIAAMLGVLLVGTAAWQLNQQRQNDLAQAMLANATRPRSLPQPLRELPSEPTAAGLLLPTSVPPSSPASPREACSTREQSTLMACVYAQCALPAWSEHAQCRYLRDTGRVE